MLKMYSRALIMQTPYIFWVLPTLPYNRNILPCSSHTIRHDKFFTTNLINLTNSIYEPK